MTSYHSNLFLVLSYQITFDVVASDDDSAYDKPTMNEKNVPDLNENIKVSETESDNIQHHQTTTILKHPSSSHLNQSDRINKTECDDSSISSSSVGISGFNNRTPNRLLLPDTDIPFRKVSAQAALCPTNVNLTPSKQVTISPSPSTISINLSGMKNSMIIYVSSII